jgi:pimeloyl-ACP methyl ester carboxylesterase
MAERDDSASLVRNAHFPMVVIHGSNDGVIPIERAREAKLLADRIHLVEVVGAGHMPMMEKPQKTADALMMLK